ncbi:MAG: ribulose-phosphate 3-epimerase [Dehalococcoidia bacterium]|nr:MAG: ribulose-phosphate 3-epimerase [Dehalococcoidia bacterium]
MVRQTETFADWIQFDIMDGIFVPSKSVIHKDIEDVSPLLRWEAHLMVKNPENYLADFKKAGAQKVIFHFEATQQPRQVISQAREHELMVGIALNPDTPISDILPFVDDLDSVLFLSVYPGFYGKEFIPKVLDKICEFRITVPYLETGIDGGIKESNITDISRCGVDCIYVGSAIFLQDNPTKSYYRLLKLVK